VDGVVWNIIEAQETGEYDERAFATKALKASDKECREFQWEWRKKRPEELTTPPPLPEEEEVDC
jgi:hypothetical protein